MLTFFSFLYLVPSKKTFVVDQDVKQTFHSYRHTDIQTDTQISMQHSSAKNSIDLTSIGIYVSLHVSLSLLVIIHNHRCGGVCVLWMLLVFSILFFQQFDLVCNKKYFRANMYMIWSLGYLVGLLLDGFISDRSVHKYAHIQNVQLLVYKYKYVGLCNLGV